jgi:RNA polymerase sigma factor (sigma-70 family)
MLRRLARASHAAPGDWEDVAQDALLRLCELGSIHDHDLGTMCKWAVNAPASRSVARARRDSGNEAPLPLGERDIDEWRSARRAKEGVETMYDALDSAHLSEVERRIVRAVLRGRKQREIGEEIGTSAHAVAMRLYRMRARMRDLW